MLINDFFINYFKFGILGNSLRLDVSNVCQLRCPSCFQSKEGESSFRKKHLKFSDFKKFVDQYPTFKKIELSDNGEIFLNPELEKIVQYAYNKKIVLTARNGVNLNRANEEVLECLVKYKFRVLLVSLDGATNETYQIYRRGGNFQKIMDNIKTINGYKQFYHSRFPILIWQFIIFGHNEHEIPLARNMARKFNMKFFLKFNADPSYSPVIDGLSVRKETGYVSLAEYEDKKNNLYSFPCHQLWLSPQISPEGDLLGCCNVNRDGAYGNVFKLGLRQVLKSEKFIYAKKMLLGHKEPRDDIPCISCNVYKKLRSKKSNLLLSFLGLWRRLKDTHCF